MAEKTETPVPTGYYVTAEELLKIEQLCCFLKEGSQIVSPDDFEIFDKNYHKLGYIRYEPDEEGFVFVPAVVVVEG